MKVVRQARLELSGGSTPDQLRPSTWMPVSRGYMRAQYQSLMAPRIWSGANGLGHANCPPPRHTFARFYTQKEQCKKLPFFERVFSRPMKLGVQNTLSTLLLHDD